MNTTASCFVFSVDQLAALHGVGAVGSIVTPRDPVRPKPAATQEAALCRSVLSAARAFPG
jgi:hypothetical protein